MIWCEWLLTVSDTCLVDRQTLLTSILSDGKQAKVATKEIGDKVQSVDEKVQVVIDGARVLPGRLSNLSNVYTFRRQTSKSCREGHR